MALKLGKQSYIPTSTRFAREMNDELASKPFELARSLKDYNTENPDRNKFPQRRVFGGDVPESVSNILPIKDKLY